MKKAILSITVLLCMVGYSKSAAQVSVAVKIGTPVHCLSPALVIVIAPTLPKKLVVVWPAPVAVIPARQVFVVQPPVHVLVRPVRRVAI